MRSLRFLNIFTVQCWVLCQSHKCGIHGHSLHLHQNSTHSAAMGLMYVDICLCVWVYACSFVAALSMYFYINDQKEKFLLACIFWRLICFSSSRRNVTSAPYFPTVPSSTRRKWECRLLRTFSLLRGFSSVWYGAIICSVEKSSH